MGSDRTVEASCLCQFNLPKFRWPSSQGEIAFREIAFRAIDHLVIERRYYVLEYSGSATASSGGRAGTLPLETIPLFCRESSNELLMATVRFKGGCMLAQLHTVAAETWRLVPDPCTI